jgi:hypothetical protein
VGSTNAVHGIHSLQLQNPETLHGHFIFWASALLPTKSCFLDHLHPAYPNVRRSRPITGFRTSAIKLGTRAPKFADASFGKCQFEFDVGCAMASEPIMRVHYQPIGAPSFQVSPAQANVSMSPPTLALSKRQTGLCRAQQLARVGDSASFCRANADRGRR